MVSATFTLNAHTVPSLADQTVSYGDTISLAITDPSGVKSVVWTFTGRSRTDVAYPTFSLSGHPSGITASFVVPTPASDTDLGLTLLFKCVVNGGRNEEGVEDAALTFYSGVGVVSSIGVVPFSTGEELEFNTELGWGERFNAAVLASTSVTELLGNPLDPITVASPSLNDILVWDGSKWIATTDASPSTPPLSSVLAVGNSTSGQRIIVSTGDTLTITDAPSSATDAANKGYVDSVATDSLATVLGVGNTTGGTDLVISSTDKLDVESSEGISFGADVDSPLLTQVENTTNADAFHFYLQAQNAKQAGSELSGGDIYLTGGHRSSGATTAHDGYIRMFSGNSFIAKFGKDLDFTFAGMWLGGDTDLPHIRFDGSLILGNTQTNILSLKAFDSLDGYVGSASSFVFRLGADTEDQISLGYNAASTGTIRLGHATNVKGKKADQVNDITILDWGASLGDNTLALGDTTNSGTTYVLGNTVQIGNALSGRIHVSGSSQFVLDNTGINLSTTAKILSGSTPATTGTIRLSSTDSIYTRNFANNGNLSTIEWSNDANNTLYLGAGAPGMIQFGPTGAGTINLDNFYVDNDNVEIAFFNHATSAQQGDIGVLTDAFGTADGTVQDVGAAHSQTILNNNFQEMSTKINAIRTLLQAYGLMA